MSNNKRLQHTLYISDIAQSCTYHEHVRDLGIHGNPAVLRSDADLSENDLASFALVHVAMATGVLTAEAVPAARVAAAQGVAVVTTVVAMEIVTVRLEKHIRFSTGTTILVHCRKEVGRVEYIVQL